MWRPPLEGPSRYKGISAKERCQNIDGHKEVEANIETLGIILLFFYY